MLASSGITVSQALNIETLKNAKVIAGINGLENIITGVNIMEVPDIANWVKSGELLLTTAYSLKDNKKALISLISDLHKKGLACIAIKTKRYIESIPQEVIDTGNKLGFPIIELPFDIAFSDITSAILREVFDKQTGILLKLEEIHNKLMGVVLSGGGLKDICDALFGIIDNPLIVKDYVFGRNMKITSANLDNKVRTVINSIISAKNTFEETAFKCDEQYMHINERMHPLSETGGWDRYIFPIAAGQRTYGEIQVLCVKRKMTPVDIRSVQYSCAIIALEIMKQMTIFEVESRHKNEFMEELLSIDPSIRTGAVQRVGIFGLEENLKYIAVVMFVENIKNWYNNMADNKELWYANKIIQAIEGELKTARHKALISSKGDNITLLIGFSSTDEEQELKKKSIEMAERVFNIVERSSNGASCFMGISRCTKNISELYKSNEEAKKALSFSKIFQNNRVIHYDDLGIFRLLCMEHQENEIKKFCHETVMPLLEYDKNKDGELVKTLRTYFECGGNLKQVCKKMYIHYNTILYRIQKIQQITNMDLSDSNSRLNLEISLKIMSMIGNVVDN